MDSKVSDWEACEHQISETVRNTLKILHEITEEIHQGLLSSTSKWGNISNATLNASIPLQDLKIIYEYHFVPSYV